MSGSFPGLPMEDRPERSGGRVFQHIPRLREILPNGGWPGITYAQVCVHNLKNAADRSDPPGRLREMKGGSIFYTIEGPKGSIEVALVGTGTLIPGASPDAGNRLFYTDGEIGLRTGLSVQYPIWLRTQASEEEPDGEVVPVSQAAAPEPRQSRESAARVQRRNAPQRVEVRAQSPEPEAGDRDRAVGSAPRGKKLLSGHSHPPNFGRPVAGCSGCARIQGKRWQPEHSV